MRCVVSFLTNLSLWDRVHLSFIIYHYLCLWYVTIYHLSPCDYVMGWYVTIGFDMRSSLLLATNYSNYTNYYINPLQYKR
jgi:hypothetical protein